MNKHSLAVETLLNSAGLKRLQAQELAKEQRRAAALILQAESLEKAAAILAKQEA